MKVQEERAERLAAAAAAAATATATARLASLTGAATREWSGFHCSCSCSRNNCSGQQWAAAVGVAEQEQGDTMGLGWVGANITPQVAR